MTSILTIDTAAATLATLRAALQSADAYNGVARFNREAMADYARKVQVLRADGETAAISRDTVDALLEAPQPEPAAEVVAPEPAAEVVDAAALIAMVEDTVAKATNSARYASKAARYLRNPSASTIAKVTAMLAEVEAGEVKVTAAMLEEAGMGKGWLRASAAHMKWSADGVNTKAAEAAGWQMVEVKRGQHVELKRL